MTSTGRASESRIQGLLESDAGEEASAHLLCFRITQEDHCSVPTKAQRALETRMLGWSDSNTMTICVCLKIFS